MITFNQFKKLDIDLSPVGFERAGGDDACFCTPVGANILGRAGVDGIHYCTVRGFGETVFAVCPDSLPGEYVCPVAKNFEDLLRLLLACGDMAAIDQAGGWNRETFDAFVREQERTPEGTEVLRELRDRLSLAPMEDPFGYIRELQSGFDYGKIRFSGEYYDVTGVPPEPAEWRVFYRGGWRGGSGRARPGEEIAIDRRFQWGDKLWHVPAVYSCAKGLVADFCVEVNLERLRAFLEKWTLPEDGEDALTREQREERDRENPLNMDFRACVVLNGAESKSCYGAGAEWVPEALLPKGEASSEEGARILEHYGLDRDKVWTFFRCSFPWPAKRRPKIRSLRLKLSHDPAYLEGIRFKDPSAGDEFTFTHPLTRTEHRLTVLATGPRELPGGGRSGEYELPVHYRSLTYTLEPDLPEGRLKVRDVLENDSPRRSSPSPGESPSAAVAVIIGGADGPAAVSAARPVASASAHTAMSALRFDPAQHVEWKLTFREKLLPDIDTELIPGTNGV